MRLHVIRLIAENGLEYTFWFLLAVEEDGPPLPPGVTFELRDCAEREELPA